MSTPPLPPDDDLLLEPVDRAPDAEPLVCDVQGRLWRVRTRPRGWVADMLLVALVLLILAAIGAALIV